MELKIICMFKIRPSVGADTSLLSKCPHLLSHQHPSPRHSHAVEIGGRWEDCSPTNKEALTHFLQLPSSEGSPETPAESQPYKVGTEIATNVPGLRQPPLQGCPETLWPSGCHHHSFSDESCASPSSTAGTSHTRPVSRLRSLSWGNRGMSHPTACTSPEGGCFSRSARGLHISPTSAPHHLCGLPEPCPSLLTMQQYFSAYHFLI